MRVERLDHVNIATDRLEETVEFCERILGLTRVDAPPPLTRETAAWIADDSGQAIFHVNTMDAPRTVDRAVEPGGEGGPIHHVALNCSGYDALIERLDAAGASYTCNLIERIGLRQVFTTDPNNVLLELNFFAD